MKYDYHPGFDMADTQALRDEIVRRETVANFAQSVRTFNHEECATRVTTQGLTLHVGETRSGVTALSYSLHLASRVLTAFNVTDPSGVGITNIECDVTSEEMLVIEDCLNNPNAYVETIIDRVWDS